MGTFSTVNPATGDVLQNYQHLSWADAEKILHSAQAEFQLWHQSSWETRSQTLHQWAHTLRHHKNELAQLMNQEMGKLLEEGEAEVEKCAITCEFYAKEGPGMLKNQVVPVSPYPQAEISFQPLGVLFCIMPWNFPLWQVIRFAAPALMAGNIIALKHADITAGTAEFLIKILSQISNPYKLLHGVPVDHRVAAQVIASPLIAGVTFTGSSSGGRAVAMEAAKNLKKIVLELGGSDAYLILDDADIKKAAKTCAKVRLINCGQSCVAGKRFIVHEKVAAEFIAELTQHMKQAPLAPLARKLFQKQIHHQVEKLKSWGGKIVCGGLLPEGAGAFYPATILVFEKDHPEIHKEEIFGPVATVVVVKSSEEALVVANSSPFGLGGGVFTQDVVRGKEMVEKHLQAGFVVVNDFVKSDPHLPFGGIKESGYGRELGHFGIFEFVNVKTIGVSEENS